jgi:hypothetical protein
MYSVEMVNVVGQTLHQTAKELKTNNLGRASQYLVRDHITMLMPLQISGNAV